MSGWLTKAQNALGYRPAGSAEPFEIGCSCGGTVTGERGPVHQQVRCARCGGTLFVLPADVYPSPKPRKLQRKSSSSSSSSSVTPRTANNNRRPSVWAKRRTATVAEGVHRTLKEGADRSKDWGRRAAARHRRFWTPLRLVMLGLAVAVLATAGLVIHRSNVREAERTLAVARDDGYAALDDGDFGAASAAFQRACAALEVLGRDGPAARRLRQMRRESTAADGLIPLPLFEICRNLAELYREDSSSWREDFRRRYGGRWIILDAPVRRSGVEDGHDVFTVDYPLRAAGKPVRIEFPLPALESTEPGEEGQRVVFAAPLEDCRLTDPLHGEWVIMLREEAFLWSDFENYRRLGFASGGADSEEAVRDLLDRQSQLMGIEP